MKHGARKKRESNKRTTDLLQQIEALELRHKHLNEEETRNQLALAREKLKDI